MKLNKNDYRIIPCSQKHFETVYQLQEEVYDHLSDRQLLIPADRSTMEFYFQDPNIVLGVEYQGEIIGFGIVHKRQDKRDLFTEALYKTGVVMEPSEFAYVCRIIIKEAYRGNGLMVVLLQELEKIVHRQGYKYMGGIAYPYNFASVAAFKKGGYRVIKRYTTEDGYLRDMFIKKTGVQH